MFLSTGAYSVCANCISYLLVLNTDCTSPPLLSFYYPEIFTVPVPSDACSSTVINNNSDFSSALLSVETGK